MIPLGHGISIRDDELRFTASRSSGPGGQNVNKVNSRVTLRFDVANSLSLSAVQKKRVLARLTSRVSGEGVLRVVSQGSRSQAANRIVAVERLVGLLRRALEPARERKETGVPQAARRRRLETKRHRAGIKEDRARSRSRED